MKKESLLKGGETKMLYWVLVKFKDTINLVFVLNILLFYFTIILMFQKKVKNVFNFLQNLLLSRNLQ